MRLAIDLMGSDKSPNQLYPGVVEATRLFPHVSFTVIVTTNVELSPHPSIKILKADEFIEMGEDPIQAIRKKKNSSLLKGLKLLKRKKVDGFITAGNTGALIACASLYLPKLPGIKRPALLATLPTIDKPVSVLDVGGTVQCKAPLLAHFAQLGVNYHRKAYNIERPRFALLNIGVESRKGSLERQEAYHKLAALNIDAEFIGNIEGRDLFSGKADVIVTDGFSGNLLIKTAEGTANYIFETLTQSLSIEGKELHKRFDWMEHPGAIVLGIEGLVMKCHGSSTPRALLSGIKGALKYI